MLQLHGRETPERAAALRARLGRPLIKALGVCGAAEVAVAAAWAGAADEIRRIRDDLAELGRLPDGWPRADVLAAFVDAFRAVWFLLLALALLGLVCVSLMKQHKLHSTLSRNERD